MKRSEASGIKPVLTKGTIVFWTGLEDFFFSGKGSNSKYVRLGEPYVSMTTTQLCLMTTHK